MRSLWAHAMVMNKGVVVTMLNFDAAISCYSSDAKPISYVHKGAVFNLLLKCVCVSY